MHKAVIGRLEAKKLLSHQRQSDYTTTTTTATTTTTSTIINNQSIEIPTGIQIHTHIRVAVSIYCW